MGVSRAAGRCLAVTAAASALGARGASCPGQFVIAGFGLAEVIPTGWPGHQAQVDVLEGRLVAHLDTRAYLAKSCKAGQYDPEQYVRLALLGKTLRYTVDMAGAGCGCNAQLQLVPMSQNPDASTCKDYYCDSNAICGVKCAEIDLQEANQFAWHTTLHTRDDADGFAGGYGGGGDDWDGPRDFSKEYGPGAACINSSRPFEVAASFPVNSEGVLEAVRMTLSQNREAQDTCSVKFELPAYQGFEELSDVLADGVTPAVSYWSNGDMSWLDGAGKDRRGPCAAEAPDACAASVAFSGFSIEPIGDATSNASHGAEAAMASTTPAADAITTSATTASNSTISFEHLQAAPQLAQAPAGSVVAKHGKLRAKGSQIVDEHGRVVRLRGLSLLSSNLEHEFWNADLVQWLAQDWHITVLRAAMGVADGYAVDPGAEQELVSAVVNACIKLGIYVVIDWHDDRAQERAEQAGAFFAEVAKRFGEHPNVIFEPFSEPKNVDWGSVVKPYHEAVVKAIRQHSENLVILGTSRWSQDVDLAAADPVDAENVAYSVHFYAASMGAPLRQKVEAALAKGGAVIASEWGPCEYSRTGRLDIPETRRWLELLDQHNISDIGWGLYDGDESCALLRPGAGPSGGWASGMLTTAGSLLRDELRGNPDAGKVNRSLLVGGPPLARPQKIQGTGCTNLRDITIGNWTQVNSSDECGDRCAPTSGCTSYSYQTSAECGHVGSPVGSCYLLSGRCEQQPSGCWDLYDGDLDGLEATAATLSPAPAPASSAPAEVATSATATTPAATSTQAPTVVAHTTAAAEPTTTTAASDERWTMAAGGYSCKNSRSITIANDKVESAAVCGGRCASAAGCVGFDFQRADSCTDSAGGTGTCRLFSRECEPSESECFDLYSMTSPSPASAPWSLFLSARGCLNWKSVSIPNTGKADSVSECGELCVSATGCVGFNYQTTNECDDDGDGVGTCVLLSGECDSYQNWCFDLYRLAAPGPGAAAPAPASAPWSLTLTGHGCQNWRAISIPNKGKASSPSECGNKCLSVVGCVSFNFQFASDCVDNGDGVGTCVLFSGECDSYENRCFDFYHITAPPPAPTHSSLVLGGHGCKNWRSISIPNKDKAGSASECGGKCSSVAGCVGFNYQTADDCDAGGNGAGTCVLFSGECDPDPNRCFDLYHLKSGAPSRAAEAPPPAPVAAAAPWALTLKGHGCQNWRAISIPNSDKSGSASDCGDKCSSVPGCVGFNYQATDDCDSGGNGVGTCVLFRAECQPRPNRCFDVYGPAPSSAGATAGVAASLPAPAPTPTPAAAGGGAGSPWTLASGGHGCRNWRTISIPNGEKFGSASQCGDKCASTAGCVGFNYQTTDECDDTGGGAGTCVLFSGECEPYENNCFDLYRIDSAPRAAMSTPPGADAPWALTLNGQGCRNWRAISIPNQDKAGSASECGSRCASTVACMGFNYQATDDCDDTGGGVGTCVLFSGECDAYPNRCFDLYGMKHLPDGQVKLLDGSDDTIQSEVELDGNTHSHMSATPHAYASASAVATPIRSMLLLTGIAVAALLLAAWWHGRPSDSWPSAAIRAGALARRAPRGGDGPPSPGPSSALAAHFADTSLSPVHADRSPGRVERGLFVAAADSPGKRLLFEAL